MLDGDKILSNQILLGKTMFLRNREMIVDLIVFDMFNFDIILGIDFLSHYGVKIDSRKKKVRFHLDNGEKFTFSEAHVWSIMVSSVKTRKNVE